MSWIEELGEKELPSTHVKLFVNIISLAAEVEADSTEESVKKQLVAYCDQAISNLERIRKEASE